MKPGTSSGRSQSAVLVPVPAAEAVVGPWRQAHDPVAPAGVPAHVTLVVPWLAPELLGAPEVEELRDALVGEEPFAFTLERVGWFGHRVLWLAPEPAATFVGLTGRLARRFGTPPYDDAFDEVVPHLTVGHAGEGADLSAVASALEAELPLRCWAEEVWVMVGDGSQWEQRARIPLGG